MYKIFLILILVAYQIVFSQPEVEIQKWSESKEWINLLHFKTSDFGKFRSLLDGPGFFLSPDGKTNPLAELKATIAAMSNSQLRIGKFNLHPQCAFPARFWFIKNRLKINIPEVSCPKLDEFLEIFHNPQNISIVFSSAYPNNPASMFGHTFIKVNSKSRADITDVGINYAAQVPDDENPFAFMYFGVNGGYLGQWSTETYHKKIKEYIQGENRDLWEYELDLTPEETHRLLLHFWEIETNSYFYYYFFDENCSYQILAAIEAIKPEWNITDYTIYVIPGESTKNLFHTPNIVKNVHFRPSIQKQIFQKYEALDENEKNEFYNLIDYQDASTVKSPLALETAILYFDFLNIKKKGQLNLKEKNQTLSILSQRAAMGAHPEIQSRLKPIVSETRPDLGHDSYALSVSQSFREREDSFASGSTTQIKIKSAYHDLMNNDLGFKRYSHIDFPGIEFQYDTDLKSFRLEQIIGLNITSLPPLNFLSHSPSWKMESGLYTARDYGCLNCRHGFLELGLGASANLFNNYSLAYALATGRAEVYDGISRGYRYGPGLDIGILLNPIEKLKFKLSYEQQWDVHQNERSDYTKYYVLQNSFFLERNQELRTTIQFLSPKDRSHFEQADAKIEFIYFFN